MTRGDDLQARLGLSGAIPGLGWALVCASLAGIASILLLALSGWFLTGAALAGVAGSAAVLGFNYLLPSAAIRGLAIMRTAGRYGERLLSHNAALRKMADLRAGLFGALAAQDGRMAPDLSGGDASARLIGDIEALENAIVRRPARAASAIAAVFGVVLVLLAGWQAALALALMLAALPALLYRLADRLTRAPATAAAAAAGDLRQRFIECAAARAEIIAYGIADRVVDDLSVAATALDLARAALFRAEALVTALLTGYGALTSLLVLLLSRGATTSRALAVLAAIAAVEAMAAFVRDALSRRGIAASLERLGGLIRLDGAPEVADAMSSAAMSLMLGDIELAPGSRVAITGASGSGKTLLLEGLAGLRPTSCRLRLGGLPIGQQAAAVIRAQFALSPQDATLIAGTIGDNLRIARPKLAEAEMWAALDTVCLGERVRAMRDRLDTRLGEAGGMLSGGERKRLSLARALLAGRPWLLLDEPTEGLDAATERDVIGRLAAWLDRTGAGLILVSHRPAPLELAGRQLAIATVLGLSAR